MKRLTLVPVPTIAGFVAILATLMFWLLARQARETHHMEIRFDNFENSPMILWREPNVKDPNQPEVGVRL